MFRGCLIRVRVFKKALTLGLGLGLGCFVRLAQGFGVCSSGLGLPVFEFRVQGACLLLYVLLFGAKI